MSNEVIYLQMRSGTPACAHLAMIVHHIVGCPAQALPLGSKDPGIEMGPPDDTRLWGVFNLGAFCLCLAGCPASVPFS